MGIIRVTIWVIVVMGLLTKSGRMNIVLNGCRGAGS